MRMVKFFGVAVFVSSGCALAADVSSATLPAQSAGAMPQGNGRLIVPVTQRRGPVVGSMLEDGREVPARFQGVESKEQRARREGQEQEQKQQGSEEE